MVKKKSVVILLSLILLTPVFASASPIPDTGQTKCYDNAVEIPCPEEGQAFYGQDGNYAINPLSYTKLDETGNVLPDDAASWVMVRDNVTGLIWEMKTDDGSIHDKDNTYSWYDSNPATNGGNSGTDGNGTDTEDFINALNAASFGGYSDWRMPTLKELRSLTDYGRYNPAINIGYFPNTQANYYWSSTAYTSDTNYGWLMDFYWGHDNWSYKSRSYYVRAVRGGQSGSFGPLVINSDGTISDTATGLAWQQATAPGTYTWAQALAYCENLSLGGHSDWRLPTIKELDSIVDRSRWNPAINTDYFPDTLVSEYWSSTTYASNANGAWGISFYWGDDGYYPKYSDVYVRAVRGGQPGSLGHLVILSPGQASRWYTGDVMPITWDTRDLGGNVSISISRDGGKTFESIADETANDGSFAWTVTGTGSVNCALKVTPLEDPSKATTQSLFTIDSCPDDPDKVEPGGCDCGVADTDTDGDKILDCNDAFPNEPIIKGDINNDGEIDLMDVILVLKIMAGMEPSSTVYKEADVNADGKIGQEEAIYILQKLADIPEQMLIKSLLPYNDSQTYDEENLSALVNGFSDFTMTFYHEIIKDEKMQGKNIFFSTYSIENALGMTWAGAKNNTAQQMAGTLHLALLPPTFHPTLNALNLDLNSRDNQLPPSGDAFQINLVNAIWSRIGYPFLAAYLDVIAQNYNAGIRALDFRSDPDGSRQIINQWVEDQTNEKIKDLLPEMSITVDTALVLTNAIYFKASWFSKFDPDDTKPGDFTRLDGSTVTAQMMHQVMDTKIFRGDDYDAVKLPYISSRFEEGQYPEELSMLFIVPHQGAFLKVENSLNRGAIDTIVASLAMGEVDLTVPKFEFEFEVSCKEILQNLGMADAFDTFTADFSGMVNSVDSRPWIDQIYHKAFIAVDEEGTEAAAATAVVMTDTSVPEPVAITLDKPFIFLIRDDITNTILFMGRVLDPAAE